MISQKMDRSIDLKGIKKIFPGSLFWRTAFVLLLLLIQTSLLAREKVIAIKAGRIQTAVKGEIENGIILVKDDKIAEIGPQVAIPSDAEIIDFQDKFIMPGIVSPDSRLGIPEPSAVPTDFFRGGELAGKNLAYYPVLYSIYPEHPDYALALKNGFTTFGISPPPAGISGLGTIIKPQGETLKDILIKDKAFLKINVYVHTPFWSMLKGALDEAKKTLEDQKKKTEEKAKKEKEKKKKEDRGKAKEEKEEPTISESAKVFMEVVEGKIPILAECDSPDAVSHLLELLANYPNVKLVIRGGAEAYKAGSLLKEKNISIILEPTFAVKQDFYTPYRERTNYVLKCQALDLKIAFQAPGTINEQVHLLDYLNELYQFGIKKDVLFKGVTLVPAQLLGIDNLVGSLEKGKKADMIVLKNDPLENTPSIEKVILGGRFVR